MNDMINKFLLVGDKFMPEMHLRDPMSVLTQLATLSQDINREFKSLWRQVIHNIYKNDLDKACFRHDMAYNKYKYLDKRTESDKV